MLACFRTIIYICEVLFRKKFFKKIFAYGNPGYKITPKHLNSAGPLPPTAQQKQHDKMPLPR